MPRDPTDWVIAVLRDLGWTECTENGDFVVVFNPSLQCSISFDAGELAEGRDIYSPLTVWGVTPEQFQQAIKNTQPDTPYGSLADF